jgi:hypothetical protein
MFRLKVSSIEEVVEISPFLFSPSLGLKWRIIGVANPYHISIIGCLRASVIRRDGAALLLQLLVLASLGRPAHIQAFPKFCSEGFKICCP